MVDIPTIEREKRKQRYNEVIRAGHAASVNILKLLDDDLKAAWNKYIDLQTAEQPTGATRGRIRGLAQAIATVKHPYSRKEYEHDGANWNAVIKKIEDDALRRVRQGRRA